jgi:hypothetical protein
VTLPSLATQQKRDTARAHRSGLPAEAGVIAGYAVFGAVAQMRHTEAGAMLDAKILVAVPEPAALDVLAPVYAFRRERGHAPEGEAVRVGD